MATKQPTITTVPLTNSNGRRVFAVVLAEDPTGALTVRQRAFVQVPVIGTTGSRVFKETYVQQVDATTLTAAQKTALVTITQALLDEAQSDKGYA